VTGVQTCALPIYNDGDGLILLNPNEEIVDSVNFGKAPVGQSYIKTDSDSEWQWNKRDEEVAPVRSPQTLQQTQIPQQSRLLEAKLVEEPLKEKQGLVSIFLTGIFIALASTTVFFAVKYNLDKTN